MLTKYISAFLVVFFSLFSPVSIATIGDHETLYTQGMTALESGNHQDAERHLQQIIELSQKDKYIDIGNILFNFGVAFYQNGNYPEAEKYLQQSVPSLSSSQAVLGDTYAHLGLIHHKQGRREKAVECYQNALKAYEKASELNHPNAKQVSQNLARLTQQTQDDQSAVPVEQTSEENTTTYFDAIDLFRKSQEELQLGNIDQAILLGQQVIAQSEKVSPEQFDIQGHAYHFVGTAFLMKHDYQQGIQYLEKAIAIRMQEENLNDPSIANILTNLIKANQQIGHYAEAEKWNEQLGLLPGQKKRSTETVLEEFEAYMGTGPIGSQQEDYFHLRPNHIVHWHKNKKQVLIYLTNGEQLKGWRPENIALVQDAFAEWQKALNDRIQFVFTDNKKQYDVLVEWREKATSDGEATKGGENLIMTWGKYIEKNDIYLTLNDSMGVTWSPYAIRAIALHEVGHMLGIQWHSNSVRDIMCALGPSHELMEHRHLTQRDINTIQALYQHPAEITNPDKYYLSEFDRFKRKESWKDFVFGVVVPSVITSF